ncbi:MAG: hypothetical protein ACK48K_07625, partial [Planctomycetota bacterium]
MLWGQQSDYLFIKGLLRGGLGHGVGRGSDCRGLVLDKLLDFNSLGIREAQSFCDLRQNKPSKIW